MDCICVLVAVAVVVVAVAVVVVLVSVDIVVAIVDAADDGTAVVAACYIEAEDDFRLASSKSTEVKASAFAGSLYCSLTKEKQINYIYIYIWLSYIQKLK